MPNDVAASYREAWDGLLTLALRDLASVEDSGSLRLMLGTGEIRGRRCPADSARGEGPGPQRFFIRFRFAAIFREARTCLATYGTQAITAVQTIAMIAASAAARCRWRMRDAGSAARTRFERSASKGGSTKLTDAAHGRPWDPR